MKLVDCKETYHNIKCDLSWLSTENVPMYEKVVKSIAKSLNNQPIAYDVDKIIEQLEEHARKERELELNSNEISENYHFGKARGFIEAIAILKESVNNEHI